MDFSSPGRLRTFPLQVQHGASSTVFYVDEQLFSIWAPAWCRKHGAITRLSPEDVLYYLRVIYAETLVRGFEDLKRLARIANRFECEPILEAIAIATCDEILRPTSRDGLTTYARDVVQIIAYCDRITPHVQPSSKTVDFLDVTITSTLNTYAFRHLSILTDVATKHSSELEAVPHSRLPFRLLRLFAEELDEELQKRRHSASRTYDSWKRAVRIRLEDGLEKQLFDHAGVGYLSPVKLLFDADYQVCITGVLEPVAALMAPQVLEIAVERSVQQHIVEPQFSIEPAEQSGWESVNENRELSCENNDAIPDGDIVSKSEPERIPESTEEVQRRVALTLRAKGDSGWPELFRLLSPSLSGCLWRVMAAKSQAAVFYFGADDSVTTDDDKEDVVPVYGESKNRECFRKITQLWTVAKEMGSPGPVVFCLEAMCLNDDLVLEAIPWADRYGEENVLERCVEKLNRRTAQVLMQQKQVWKSFRQATRDLIEKQCADLSLGGVY